MSKDFVRQNHHRTLFVYPCIFHTQDRQQDTPTTLYPENVDLFEILIPPEFLICEL